MTDIDQKALASLNEVARELGWGEIGIGADDYLVKCFARYREAVIEECAKALEADAMKCDCAALEERECGCGAWCEWKSITSARAVEIVRELKDTK